MNINDVWKLQWKKVKKKKTLPGELSLFSAGSGKSSSGKEMYKNSILMWKALILTASTNLKKVKIKNKIETCYIANYYVANIHFYLIVSVIIFVNVSCFIKWDSIGLFYVVGGKRCRKRAVHSGRVIDYGRGSRWSERWHCDMPALCLPHPSLTLPGWQQCHNPATQSTFQLNLRLHFQE